MIHCLPGTGRLAGRHELSQLFGEVYGIIGCSIGRAVTPTLAMIVGREAKISGFVRKPFYVVGLSDGRLSAEREEMGDKSAAKMVAAVCEGKTATVKSVEQERKIRTGTQTL